MKKLAYSLILIPIILITLRMVFNDEPDPGVISEITYDITYSYNLNGQNQFFDVEFYLPQNDIRQDISFEPNVHLNSEIAFKDRDTKRILEWSGSIDVDTTISFQYSAKTRHVEYNIDKELVLGESGDEKHRQYLVSSSSIQAYHPEIKKSSDRFLLNSSIKVKDVAEGLFNYVEQIPSVRNGKGSDALSCHKNRICTEEGKNRLLTALFRSAGIPARMAGGLVLKDKKKSNLDYWMQANIGGEWVTFDPERGHFAELPATHLELFSGDITFDDVQRAAVSNSYYDIKKERLNNYPEYAMFNIWNLIDSNELPHRPMMVLLLLPLGAYIVAICTNVVGFKTYGVFLPVLIAFSFIDMGLLQGIVFFTVIIGLISLMSFPLERWGILHTPKIVCLLTVVGIYCMAAVKLFYVTGWVAPSATLTFPVIILTLIAERFAQKVEEESLSDALFVYGQTLIVTVSCYWILSANVIQHFFITFPEILIAIAGLSLLLGKWIGLQLFEYTRFAKIDEEISYAK